MALIQSSLSDGVGAIALDNYTHRNALSAALIAEAIAAFAAMRKAQARQLLSAPTISSERVEYQEEGQDCLLASKASDVRGRQGPLWAELISSPGHRGMAASCAKPPFVMARQTGLHHRSNQTRNRRGWRCLAERKLRLRVRQYGERYLWFESISLRHELSVTPAA